MPLRKVCRRPETDHRLQQLHVKKELGPASQQKTGADPPTSNTLRVYPPLEPRMQKQQQKAERISDAVPVVVPPTSLGNVNVSTEAKVLQPKATEIISSCDAGTSVVMPPVHVPVISDAATSTVLPPANVGVTSGTATSTVLPPANVAVTSGAATSTVSPPANVAVISGAATSTVTSDSTIIIPLG